jgi:hypothetical protein
MSRYDELAEGFLASNGSDIDFGRVAREVGFERCPKRDSKAVTEAMSKALLSKTTGNGFGGQVEEPPTVDEDQSSLANLLAEEHDPNWTELARLSKRILAKISAGIIRSNQGQVSALKEVIGRAEGRIGADAEDKEEKTHILILPTEDSGQGPSVIVPSNLEE